MTDIDKQIDDILGNWVVECIKEDRRRGSEKPKSPPMGCLTL